MELQEYKDKKLDKLTRDVVHMVNQLPTIGYGEVIDTITKTAMTNYLLSIVNISTIRDADPNVKETDMDILIQSLLEDMTDLSVNLISKLNQYKRHIEVQENS